jgi:hypothetical protein
MLNAKVLALIGVLICSVPASPQQRLVSIGELVVQAIRDVMRMR